jgi:segregation and condensation protein B
MTYVIKAPRSFNHGVSYIIRRNLWFQLINTPLIALMICLYRHFVLNNLSPGNQLSWSNYLETLAIIAYGQPITRQGISSIRGVNSDSSVNSLIDKGLVRESGPADAPGNPMTYSTTRTFLEKFSLSSVKDLPPLEDFAPDDETARYLGDGLLANAHSLLLPDEDALTGEDADIELSDSLDQAAQDAMRSMIADALAESAGVVEKIDFDQLDFEE